MVFEVYEPGLFEGRKTDMSRINDVQPPEEEEQVDRSCAPEPERRHHRRGPMNRFVKILLGILAVAVAAIFLLYLYLFLTA